MKPRFGSLSLSLPRSLQLGNSETWKLLPDLQRFEEDHQMGDQDASNPVIELHGDEFWPLSGKPFFDVIITKSNVKPTYRLVIPTRFRQELPSSSTPVVLTFRGKKWEMLYNGSDRLDGNWKAFVIDTNLKIGDACVFEFVKRNDRRLVWRVQILRGDFPSKIVDNCDGDTGDAPIVIE